MAHHLLEKMAAEKQKDIQVYSCGIYAQTGDGATYEAIEVMKEYGVDLKKHRATNIAQAPLDQMDLILCATTSHKQAVKMLRPELAEKIYTLKEYTQTDTEEKDIPDPWGYTQETYRRCASEIEKCLEKIVNS